MSTNTIALRTAALARFKAGEAAVSSVFDANDELLAVLASISACAAGSDGLKAAGDLEAELPRLRAAVASLRITAACATTYSSKSDLATNIGTKSGLLFPREAGSPSAVPTVNDPTGTRLEV